MGWLRAIWEDFLKGLLRQRRRQAVYEIVVSDVPGSYCVELQKQTSYNERTIVCEAFVIGEQIEISGAEILDSLPPLVRDQYLSRVELKLAHWKGYDLDIELDKRLAGLPSRFDEIDHGR
ncbi:MAG: hypothetical protein QE269_07790 [Fimbriimonas sp.]|jgi:hypothetical protein|nr:hypothetical protein [Fimbriimonas sp.]